MKYIKFGMFMTFYVNMTTLTVKVLLLFGFQAIALNQTYGELNASVSEGCLVADKSFLSLVQLSINQCAAECFLRPKCMSLKYKRRFNLCELLDFAREESLSTFGQERGGCIYVRKSDIHVIKQVSVFSFVIMLPILALITKICKHCKGVIAMKRRNVKNEDGSSKHSVKSHEREVILLYWMF